MQSLYYFCRAADDAVDEAPDEKTARMQLDFWQEEIERLYNGQQARHSITQQLGEAIDRFAMSREPFDELLRGLRHDCPRPAMLQTTSDLEDYCYCVAGCVGLQAMRIFGCDDDQGQDFALQLGQALQLTNILRDIEEDGKEQRCYIPRDWLAEIGLERATAEEVGRCGERLLPLRKKLASKAEKAFLEADNAAKELPSRPILPALLMRDIYKEYLRALISGQRPKKATTRQYFHILRSILRYL